MAEPTLEIAVQEPPAENPMQFGDLVREHQSMVFSVAWHCLRDRAVAEEVAQEVFLELHRSLGSIESPAHARNWLRRMAVHRSIDEIRRRRFRPWVALEGMPEPAVPAASADPLLEDRLRKLVAALPEKSRMLVVLRFQEELEWSEICEILDLPLGTAKSRLHRALETLRGKLGASPRHGGEAKL
jgi:RNA polymerase sigma-70 factor (ECF subfamily)